MRVSRALQVLSGYPDLCCISLQLGLDKHEPLFNRLALEELRRLSGLKL